MKWKIYLGASLAIERANADPGSTRGDHHITTLLGTLYMPHIPAHAIGGPQARHRGLR